MHPGDYSESSPNGFVRTVAEFIGGKGSLITRLAFKDIPIGTIFTILPPVIDEGRDPAIYCKTQEGKSRTIGRMSSGCSPFCSTSEYAFKDSKLVYIRRYPT